MDKLSLKEKIKKEMLITKDIKKELEYYVEIGLLRKTRKGYINTSFSQKIIDFGLQRELMAFKKRIEKNKSPTGQDLK